MTVRIGILGYGNLGKGVELAVRQNDDLELEAVYTRRDPATVKIATEGVAVRPVADLETGNEPIDVLIICGGSATDLPEQTPKYAALYNVVDSFDTHARIPEHFANVNAAATGAGNVALISCGWDPGLFSLNRLLGNCFLPQGKDYTFWGKGISQGHSDAIRRIEGVADAKQYTIPVPKRSRPPAPARTPSSPPARSTPASAGSCSRKAPTPPRSSVRSSTMPNYFDEYDVTVNFISQEELDRDHAAMPHGGFVLRSGQMASGKKMRHRVLAEARLEPRVHVVRARGLRPRGRAPGRRGQGRREDRVRHRAGVPFALRRRVPARPHAVNKQAET